MKGMSYEMTDSHRAKISKSSLGKKMSIEARNKMSESHQGMLLSETHKAAIGNGQTKYDYDPYGKLNLFWHAFHGIHNRGTEVSPVFSRTKEGFVNFVNYLGDPGDMKRPSVGRFDHDEGYVLGNFAWQEFNENAKLKHKKVQRPELRFVGYKRSRSGETPVSTESMIWSDLHRDMQQLGISSTESPSG